MQNYIILNGQISTNIPGLLIQELPPISKPLIRTEVEEIDGRDGDIVTKLGYSAYNKELTIGLYSNFDINEVIQYFNNEGTVTFSNEPDKYYNYQILDQIDFERLLRFRTATVNMHVQPFKYSLEDNEKTFTINNNLFNFNTYSGTSNNLTLTASEGVITITGTATKATEFYMPITGGTLTEGDYTLKATANGTGVSTSSIRLIGSVPSNADSFGGNYVTLQNGNTVTLTDSLAATKTFNYLWFYINPGTAMDYTLTVEVTNDNPTNSISIRNAGNIYSKPTITIYGGGTIELYLNELAIFSIDLGSFDYITIDTNLMEAYNDTQLLNRYISGDYDNFQLNVGLNNISWTGDITEIQINNYSRWI